MYPWRDIHMSALCPPNISREIYVFFKVATRPCSQSYWSWSQAMAGGSQSGIPWGFPPPAPPRPPQPVSCSNSDCMCLCVATLNKTYMLCLCISLVRHISLARHISLVRCCVEIVRTYISRDICPHYILLRFSPLFRPTCMQTKIINFQMRIHFH